MPTAPPPEPVDRRELRLRPLCPYDEQAVVAGHAAMAREAFTFALGYRDGMAWSAYLDELAAHRRGDDLPDDWVASTFLAAEVGGVVVGRTSIRHELGTEFLATEGGHIGYGVLPPHRRQGHATEILRQSLVVARAEGIDRVLITCDEGNVGSATVIERCGGVLESVTPRPNQHGVLLRRYWID